MQLYVLIHSLTLPALAQRLPQLDFTSLSTKYLEILFQKFQNAGTAHVS